MQIKFTEAGMFSAMWMQSKIYTHVQIIEIVNKTLHRFF